MVRTRLQQHNDSPLPERLHRGILLFDRAQSVEEAGVTAWLLTAELDAVDPTAAYDVQHDLRRSVGLSN